VNSENSTSSGGYSAFVSHAAADHEAARAIVADLEGKGLRCWIAPRDVRPGEEYASEIIRGIERSRCFVLVLSGAANDSSMVRREVERAASKGKPIYPVRIEDVPPSPKLEFFISMHHWLDAFEGITADAVSRLAEAFESEEQWVGNVVLKRRRQRVARFGVGTMLAVVVIVLGFVFAPDIRNLFSSEEERAVQTLRERGIAVNTEGIGEALRTASIKDLELFTRAGMNPRQLNEAFAAHALGFFEQARGNREAIDWFRDALEFGLDPNLLTPHEYYGRAAVLSAAMRAGNAGAVIALVEAGASPHVYQDLWLLPAEAPAFLFPYAALPGHDGFTQEEKRRIAEAYREAGAVFMTLQSDRSPGRTTYQTLSVERVQEEAEAQFGFALEETPPACEGRTSTPISRAASLRDGMDWCAFMAELPVRILWDERSYDNNLFRIDLQHLLTVVDGRAYVLATQTIGTLQEYLLVEISADQSSWQIYKHTFPIAGKGHCKPAMDGFQPERCWRRWAVTYNAGAEVARIDDYYEYEVLFDCAKERP
jgi:hypothetical protein